MMPELEINYLLFAVYCLQKIPHKLYGLAFMAHG